MMLSRRRWLGLTAGATLAGALPGQTAAANEPSLHVCKDYAWLRGFSMVPSWGARIEEAWWGYDGARMREEAALATQVHANCIRLWIEFTAWMADPDKVTAHFMDAVAAIAEQGMKVMPCLFNRWHDSRYDYGGTYVENFTRGWEPHLGYVRALVAPLAKDERVLIWDLCNEPQARDLSSEVNKKEYAWLEAVARTVRDCGARQPITVGTMTGGNIETFAPLMDVLCAHPYARDRAGLEKQITDFQGMAGKHGKPLLANECIPGAMEDATRAEVAGWYTESLAAAGFGWMGWALREGRAISTRRDRCDGNGINGVGYHPFFTREGKLRGGLEFLTRKPTLTPPWRQTS